MKDSIKVKVTADKRLDESSIPVITLSFYSYDLLDKHSMAKRIIDNMGKAAYDNNIVNKQLPSIDIEKGDYIEGIGQEYSVILYFMSINIDWFYFQFFKDIIGNYISDNYLR